MSYCIVITTTTSEQEAKQLTTSILGLKLAACVQLSNIISYYRWEDKITKDDEIRLLIKTKKSLYDNLHKHIVENHSFDTPEIIMLDVAEGDEKYLDWIEEVTI